METKSQSIWRVVEYGDYHEKLRKHEEKRIKSNLSFEEAKSFLAENPNKPLYAYLPSLAGAVDKIFNEQGRKYHNKKK